MEQKKLSISWKLTIATIIIAVVMQIIAGPLGEYNLNIPEELITNLVYLALGVSAIGAGVSIDKRHTKPKTPSTNPPN
jgi:hypothetical protein